MHRTRNTILALLMAAAGLAAAPALYAQDTERADPSARHHMMGGDMDGMMKMMGADMGAMTEACTRMMQSMHQPGNGGDVPQHNPPTDPDRKG
jgi:hypothetical protein